MLLELLIVVAILTGLGVLGITLYNVSRARDDDNP